MEVFLNPNVSNVEDLIVGTACEVDLQRLANTAVNAVAARQVSALQGLVPSIRVTDLGVNAVERLSKGSELCVPDHLHAGLVKLLQKEAFVVVLRIGQEEGKRAESCAQFTERGGGDFLAFAFAAFVKPDVF